MVDFDVNEVVDSALKEGRDTVNQFRCSSCSSFVRNIDLNCYNCHKDLVTSPNAFILEKVPLLVYEKNLSAYYKDKFSLKGYMLGDKFVEVSERKPLSVCAYCDTTKGEFVIHHLTSHPNEWRIQKGVRQSLFNEFVKRNPPPQDFYEVRMVCGNCESINLRHRKTKNEWVCNRCFEVFSDNNIKKINHPVKSKFDELFSKFIRDNLSEIASVTREEYARQYLEFMDEKNCKTACKRCHYMWESKRLRWCQTCKKRWHQLQNDKCSTCNTKEIFTNWINQIMKLFDNEELVLDKVVKTVCNAKAASWIINALIELKIVIEEGKEDSKGYKKISDEVVPIDLVIEKIEDYKLKEFLEES